MRTYSNIKMARKGDLAGFLRGLEYITKSLIETQSKECSHAWQNSSFKTAVRDAGNKVQEATSQLPMGGEGLQQTIGEKFKMMATQAVTVSEMMRAQAPPTVQDFTSWNTAEEMGTSFDENFDIDSPIIDSQDINNKSAESVQEKHSFNVTPPEMSKSQTKKTEGGHVHLQSKDVKHLKQTMLKDILEKSKPPKQEIGNVQNTMLTDVSSNENIDKSTFSPKRVSVPGVGIPKQSNISMADFKSPTLGERARERRVPATRISRLVNFGSLTMGLGLGAAAEITKRTLGMKTPDKALDKIGGNPFLTEANAERIVNTLCRVRGAALKLGQMISIQDNNFINPEFQKIFDRVRQSADFMPTKQTRKVLNKQLGPEWVDKLLEFDEKPFAAASIGQVHKGKLLDGRDVAIKIQYPGVANSIDSDINNLMGTLKIWNFLPKGLYVEDVIKIAKMELAWEVDYYREARCSKLFREQLKDDPVFVVPEIIDELSAGQVLTSEFIEGIPLDKCADLEQETRDMIAENILRLCMTELYDWRFMQTDPNWANFFYNPETGKLALLDFGASRSFPTEFVDRYIMIIKSAADKDREGILKYSQEAGFLTGYESKDMVEAHIKAISILGESISSDQKFDFGLQNTTGRVMDIIPVMAKDRLTPPPPETYSLHRKMAGAFLICTKLRARVNCKKVFDDVWSRYEFGRKDDASIWTE